MAAATIDGKGCQATTFCVTGGTGFVASWLVKRLLDKGYIVHATVRDPENEARVRHLLEIPGAAERLKLFRAELSEDGSFDAAVAGCHGVFHVATPIDFAPKDPETDVIKPAVEGTLSVLRACTKAQTVKRVVVTSSAATFMTNESAEQNQSVDESCWTDVDSIRTKKPHAWGYAVSKNLAERAALQYGKEYDLDVVTIIPVVVVGPSITPNVPSSVQTALSLLTGIPHGLQSLKALQMLSGCIPLVHVDDLSSAHIFLMENPSAEGRYICCPISTSVPQLAHYLSKRYPQYNVPTLFEDVPETPKLNISSKKLVESGFSFKFGIDEIYDDAVEYLKTKGLLN
jgi:anthocyanidin reductase